MTREEEIKNAASSLCDGDCRLTFIPQAAFVMGAEWADRTMIDKACEWLESNCTHLVLMKGEYYDSKEIVEQFKKAMEE